MRNILRIHLGSQTWHIEAVESGPYADLGGRGLTSKIIAAEVPPTCDALSEANKIVFAGGLFAGSSVPNGGRLSIGAKSPLTKTIKEANAGGSAAHKLARLGICAIVVEGKAETPVCLKIDSEGVQFLPADGLQGLGNYATIERLRQAHGDDVGLISIGPAGELQLFAAVIAVATPDFHIRTASRGGLGAVMGSKDLKAIIIDDRNGKAPDPKNASLLKESAKALAKGIISHPVIGGLQAFGTPLLVGLINEMGGLATRNYSVGRFEGASKIGGEAILESMKDHPEFKQTHRCMTGCVVGCSSVLTSAEGELLTSGLEFETIALMGSNCLIDDIDAIIQMDRLCDDFGIDTMDTGAAIGVCMEAGVIPWGDAKAAIRLIEGLAEREKNSLMVGNGALHTGMTLGVKRIPQVKGQGLAGYDPRVLKGTGVTYATSTMGADHTCGNALPSPANPTYNPSSPTGQHQVSKFLQVYFAAIDTLGFCLFAALPALDMPELQSHIIGCAAGILGCTLDENYLMSLGASVLQTEREFNRAAGIRNEDDRLPRFFNEETIAPSGNTFDVSIEDLDLVHA